MTGERLFETCSGCGGRAVIHRPVHIDGGDGGACVDAGVAPLIEALWAAGIRTIESCEDDPTGDAHIKFERFEDVGRVMDHLGRCGLQCSYLIDEQRWIRFTADPGLPTERLVARFHVRAAHFSLDVAEELLGLLAALPPGATTSL
jgi:hypothetical protein